ncbi:MAG: hypothetical protein Q7S83_02845 [bacterium]|nr:hypothetical protein [bacterium]
MIQTVVVDTRKFLEGALTPIQEEQEMELECLRAEEARLEVIHQAEKTGGWTSVRQAMMLMGSHCVGLKQIIDRFGLSLLPHEVRGLEIVNYPEDMLWSLRNSHLLIAGAPVTMLEIRQAACKRQKDQKLGDFSYDDQFFAIREMQARWYLVSREITRNSLYRTMRDHDERIFNNPMHERLGAPELAYVASVSRLIVGEPMLQNVAAFTSDSVSDECGRKCPVFVGFSGEFGVAVGTCAGDRPMANIGAIVSVRPCAKK